MRRIQTFLVVCLLSTATVVAAQDAPKLQVLDQRVGDGTVAARGMDVTVDYTGWLYDPDAPDQHGAKVDSSHDGGGPMTFRLGAGEVVRGWDKGVAGMRVGGQRRLVLPPRYAYGRKGVAGIVPPDATLVFEIELLDAQRH